MRALVQRVTRAEVRFRPPDTSEWETVGSIGPGLCVLVAATHDDTEATADKLADKLWGLRIFDDADGVMNLSVADVAGTVLVVSQFTLYGDTRKGRRPGYSDAARPEVAEPLVEVVIAELRSLGAEVVIDYRAEDIAESVLAATAGKGVDVVYDPVGGETFTSATKCIAHEGRILAIGFASGRWGTPDVAHMVERNYSVLGVVPSGYDRAFKEAAQERLLEWWRQGEVVIPVDEAVAFGALPEALERLKAGGVRGKLTLVVDPRASLTSSS